MGTFLLIVLLAVLSVCLFYALIMLAMFIAGRVDGDRMTKLALMAAGAGGLLLAGWTMAIWTLKP